MGRRLTLLLVVWLAFLQAACSGPSDPDTFEIDPSRGAASSPAGAGSQAVAHDEPRHALAAIAGDARVETSLTIGNVEPVSTVIPFSNPTLEPTPLPARGQIEPVPILMYHYVRPDPGAGDPVGQNLSVTPADFALQVDHLANQGYTSMTMSELADVRAGKQPLPAKPVLLTFDDGYRDFYTNAWPVLKQQGFKATVFVITGVVDQPGYLTWDLIRELHDSGLIEIGSHTVTHRELPDLSNTQARTEVTRSKQELERQIGAPVRSFCYPVGRYVDRDLPILERAGYEIAVTTKGGFARADSADLLLPRVRVVGPRAIAQIKANLP